MSDTGRQQANKNGAIMKDLQAKGINAAERFLVRKGYEIIDREWGDGKETGFDIVALNNGELVFVNVSIREGAVEGLPTEVLTEARQRIEIEASVWLSDHIDDKRFVDIAVRFDTIALMVISNDRALLRHHINAIG